MGDAEKGDSASLLALAQSDPHATIEQTARAFGVDREAAIALRARAVAFRVLDRNAEALETIQLAAEIADHLGDLQLIGECLLTRAPLDALGGDIGAAFDALQRSAECSDDALHLADVAFQRAGISLLVAEWRDAHRSYSLALETFRQHDASALIADTLLARGLMAAYLGDASAAEADLHEAIERFESLDDGIGSEQARWNLALARSMCGDPAGAIPLFDQAAAALEERGFPVDLFLGDRADALFALGLHEEAITTASRCAAAYDRLADQEAGRGSRRNALDAASRRLELARIHLVCGDPLAAASEAEAARVDFEQHGQRQRALFAELIELSAAAQRSAGPDLSALVARASAVEDALRGVRHPEWRTLPRLVCAQAELNRGDGRAADAHLAAAARHPRSPVIELMRLELNARSAIVQGSDALALRRVRSGLATLASDRRLSGSSFVRAAMTRRVESLADVGLGVLLRRGDGLAALQLLAQVHELLAMPSDVRSASAMHTEYRAVEATIVEASNEGRSIDHLVRRRNELQDVIAQSERHATDATVGLRTRFVPPHDLVCWLCADGDVFRLARVGRSWSVEQCVSIAELEVLVRDLQFVLESAFRRPSESRVERVRAAAVSVDRALGADAIRRPSRGVQIHATGAAAAVPWSLLPSLAERVWVRVDELTDPIDIPGPPASVGVVCGPGLAHSPAEADRVASVHADRMAASIATTADDALDVLGGADLVHIAAHSALNVDNPMFSSIMLDDGGLSLYDLERLPHRASTAVLASCESARSHRVGLGGVGLSTALLAGGLDAVVGTALEIPDLAETVDVMAALHRELRRVGPVEAVAAIDRRALSPVGALVADCLVPHVRAPLA